MYFPLKEDGKEAYASYFIMDGKRFNPFGYCFVRNWKDDSLHFQKSLHLYQKGQPIQGFFPMLDGAPVSEFSYKLLSSLDNFIDFVDELQILILKAKFENKIKWAEGISKFVEN